MRKHIDYSKIDAVTEHMSRAKRHGKVGMMCYNGGFRDGFSTAADNTIDLICYTLDLLEEEIARLEGLRDEINN